MYVTIKQLAAMEGCSERQLRRYIKEMELSGQYPEAVKQVGGIKVDPEQFNRWATRRRNERMRNGRKDESNSSGNGINGGADVIDLSSRVAEA